MTKFQAGDKITVEYELNEREGRVGFNINTTIGARFCYLTDDTRELKIITHTFEPIELKAGQLWKRIDNPSRDFTVVSVDPVDHDGGRRRFVVFRYQTDIPQAAFYDDFIKGHSYVSG